MSSLWLITLGAVTCAVLGRAGSDFRQGCCFEIGYGNQMKPCCLKTRPNVNESACPVEHRMGGAQGFQEGVCPASADAAAASLMANLSEDVVNIRGCCFRIGYGDEMKPCCLTTTPNIDASACQIVHVDGGAQGFQEGVCPMTADAAAALLQGKQQTERATNLSDDAASGRGCCFDIGYGFQMKPCCLKTQPNIDESACHVEHRPGGAQGFQEGACPASADAAAVLLQNEEPIAVALDLSDDAARVRGCCFKIGYGDEMKPCCLATTPNIDASACQVVHVDGGAQGFQEGVCPMTADAAAVLLQGKQQTELATNLSDDAASGRGCCFEIGYGDQMKPCCLKTQPNIDESACHVEQRPGGAQGFQEGACPLSAGAAAALLNNQGQAQVVTDSIDDAASRRGCCFVIGYGDFMKPCCLKTTPNVDASCRPINHHGGIARHLSGGAMGFHEGRCPASAKEAGNWLHNQALAPSGVTVLELGAGRFAAQSFARPIVIGMLLACVALVAVATYMRRARAHAEPEADEFVLLAA